MSVNSKSFPHPVLGNEDDIRGSFNVEFKYELSRNSIVLDAAYKLENSTIESLIKKGKASFILEIECRSSFFRGTQSGRSVEEKWVIPSRYLRERVMVSFYICADENIKNYSPAECHSDYEGFAFEIEKGEILAVGGSCSFIAEKSFDPLRPPVSSIMAIREGRRHQGTMEVDYQSDKIMVELSKSDWKNYLEVKKQSDAIGAIHASIVLPVLIDAIYKMQTCRSEYEYNNWFGRLEAILDAKGLQGQDPFEAAQRILDVPLSRSFQSISAMLDLNSNNENEYE